MWARVAKRITCMEDIVKGGGGAGSPVWAVFFGAPGLWEAYNETGKEVPHANPAKPSCGIVPSHARPRAASPARALALGRARSDDLHSRGRHERRHLRSQEGLHER